MSPRAGELWEVTETQRVAVGQKIATFLISGPALVLEVHRNHDGAGDYYTILWGGQVREIIDSAPWRSFGERIS